MGQVFEGVPDGIGLTFDDLRAFPRRVPEGTTIMERFPLRPVTPEIQHIRADLLGQLAMADGDRRTACVLVGGEKGYGGHSTRHVEDPFTMALDTVPHGASLLGAMVTGAGAIKEKHTLPSGKSWDRLAGLLTPDASIIVVQPDNPDLCRLLTARWLNSAYEPKVPSKFQEETLVGIYREALEITNLSEEDCEFVARLRLAGLEDGTSYYLTGSATSDSGPSVALRPGMYSDLDIIAVSEKPRDEVEAQFEATAHVQYGPLLKVPKLVKIAGTDRMLEGCIYTYPDGTPVIDFYTTRELSDAFVRPEYLERNFYHQIS